MDPGCSKGMNQPVFALAGVAAVLVAIFVVVWLRDARRSKGEVVDAGRLDVESPAGPDSEAGSGHQ